ncbi:MAG: SDR family NAD(P)-dependent oxidoreductase [Pseudonocardia sp.]|nr:SDR family NAD(P)-dependent oxidoreductase [Pseudonocardia sp.]
MTSPAGRHRDPPTTRTEKTLKSPRRTDPRRPDAAPDDPLPRPRPGTGPPAPVALVTGASAGIGAAFAARLAANGHDLVLVARSDQRLRDTATTLTRQHGVAVEVLGADLATAEGQRRVAHRLAEPTRVQAPVDLLINNAGSASAPDFADTDPTVLRAALELNVAAVLELTRAALPGMLARGHGAILNVSSVNAFLTLPGGAATYGANKTYVTALTKAIALTLTGSRVQIMALCPGPTRTDFHTHNGTREGVSPAWLSHSPEWVVERALADLHRGRTVSIPGLTTKLIALAGPHMPLPVTAFAVRRTRARRARSADPMRPRPGRCRGGRRWGR